MFLSAGALYAYWHQSGVELYPSESSEKSRQVETQTNTQPNAIVAESNPEPVSEPQPGDVAGDDANEDEELTLEQEIEKAWDKEVLGHLNRLEPLKANELYSAYLKERERYSQSLERNLEQSLGILMNGTDQAVDDRSNAEHQRNLEQIFGKHHEYMDQQRQKFLESYRDIDPTGEERE